MVVPLTEVTMVRVVVELVALVQTEYLLLVAMVELVLQAQ
jgi:hypothetical protein